MKSFEFEQWDGGRLTVNREWCELFRANGLTTFDSLMNFTGGSVAKNLLRERTTTRFELPDANADGRKHAFYIKRHVRPPWKEYVKPLFRLTLPILGARNEWQAILQFHSLGIPTMVPVCLGERRSSSFLVTEAIDGFQKLSDWMEAGGLQRAENGHAGTAERVIDRVAEIARLMHGAGLHHQDFYLTHLLLPLNESTDAIHVIDLGRVRARRPLATRWVVKDLAQLSYSARLATPGDRRRFLETYLGRPVQNGDRSLVRRIERKSQAIARHSRKRAL